MFIRGGDGGGHLVALLLLIALLAALVVAIVWVVRALGERGHTPGRGGAAHVPPPTQPSPREILDRRLAGGEVTPEQYDVVRSKLDSG